MENEYSYVNKYETPECPPLTWRDWAAPALAVVLAVLYWAVFSFESITAADGPGLGVPVFTATYFGAVLVILGKKAKWSAAVIGLMCAAMVLAVSCFLWCYVGIMVLNCFVILAVSAMATFLLSGHIASVVSGKALWQTAKHTLFALFSRIPAPFQKARQMAKGRGEIIGRALLALGAVILLGGAVLLLLTSADAVFKSYVNFEKLAQIDFALGLAKVIRTLVLALLVCSGLFYVRERKPAAETADRPEKQTHVMPFLSVACVLDVIYILFCAVQLRYLFGGAENAAMAGGWAEYARTGFFQLAAVAVINLTVCLAGTDNKRFALRGGLVLRIMYGLMLVLTVVILASAVYRMRLYIDVYGLSILRLMTLCAMAVIAVGVVLAGVKLIRPGFRFIPVFGAAALFVWCLFCLCGPAARVADYNVNAYLSGQLAQMDVDYLECFGSDAIPALERLMEESDACDREARMVLHRIEEMTEDAGWSQWKLSYRR